MARLARRLAPAAALGGLAVVIVGVADPALAGRTDTTATGTTRTSAATGTTDTTDSTGTSDTTGTTDTTTPSVSTCADGDQVTGDEVMTRWGPVQVTATVSGGQVCQVQGVEWPTGDGRSQMINAYAVPQLDAMATASPTQFDYVSGATYTSQGYHDSLQSILDSL